MSVIQPTPALFVFEDVHYFDEASGALLRALIAAGADRPWLILLTRRAGRGSRFVNDQPHARTLGLAPLDQDTATAFIEAMTGDAPPSENEVAALVARAGGNPMFLRELLAAWRRAGTIDDLPDTVETLMTARIDGLPPADRAVLRSAAVLGSRSIPGSSSRPRRPRGAGEDDPIWRRLAGLDLARRARAGIASRTS